MRRVKATKTAKEGVVDLMRGSRDDAHAAPRVAEGRGATAWVGRSQWLVPNEAGHLYDKRKLDPAFHRSR